VDFGEKAYSCNTNGHPPLLFRVVGIFKPEAETIYKLNLVHDKEKRLPIESLITMFGEETVECKSVQQKDKASTRPK
jgi:hypothetical protein